MSETLSETSGLCTVRMEKFTVCFNKVDKELHSRLRKLLQEKLPVLMEYKRLRTFDGNGLFTLYAVTRSQEELDTVLKAVRWEECPEDEYEPRLRSRAMIKWW